MDKQSASELAFMLKGGYPDSRLISFMCYHLAYGTREGAIVEADFPRVSCSKELAELLVFRLLGKPRPE